VRTLIPLSAPMLVALVCGVVHADPPASAETPLSVTVSGGGTKGAYMAGHLYYMGHMSRRSPALRTRVLTGASAGAMNSAIAAVTGCTPGELNPQKSLYYRAWTTVGLSKLFVPDKTTATGVFTIQAYDPILAALKGIWDAGLPTDCDLLLGVAVTRAKARNVAVAPKMPKLPVSRETVLLRITGQGPDKPPLLRNQPPSNGAVGRILLPLDGPGTRPFEALKQAVLASAALPVAFSPVTIDHCPASAKRTRCTVKDARPAAFVDGGIFDNQPLGLAVDAMKSIPGATNPRFYFLDPRVIDYPTAVSTADAAPPEHILDVLLSLTGMTSSSFSRELVSTFEREPQLRKRLLLGRTYFPHVSSTLTGLLDRAFREFDFYLGMYNAARTVREHALGRGIPDLEKLAMRGKPSLEMARGWRPFLCLRAVLDGVGNPEICGGEELQDFRILLQLTLDRLGDECLRAKAAGKVPKGSLHPVCRAALFGGRTVQVDGVRKLPHAERKRGKDENILNYQLRLLGAYRFHFQDLELDRDDAEQAKYRLLRRVSGITKSLADAQPAWGIALGGLSRIGVDLGLGYLPPVHTIHATLGLGFELGYSGTVDAPGWNRLRFGVALGFDGLSTVLTGETNYFALVPKVGLEVELYGTGVVQLRLGARVGYQLSTGDGFASGTCDYSRESDLPCSRFVSEAYLSASFLGFVRVQLAGAYYPGLNAGQRDRFALRPTLGVQFNSPF